MDDCNNYRPVCGLSFISKLVERVVAKQLLEHSQVHNLDNLYQSAYKQVTQLRQTALLSIKNELYLSLSRGKPTALILLDVLAAFDTINHSTLLSCLHTWFGVGGSVLKGSLPTCLSTIKSIKIGSTLTDLSYLVCPKVLSWVLYCFYYTLPPQFGYR